MGGWEAHALGWVDKLGRRVVQAEMEARVGGGGGGGGSRKPASIPPLSQFRDSLNMGP